MLTLADYWANLAGNGNRSTHVGTAGYDRLVAEVQDLPHEKEVHYAR